jgi:hypothetical protein
MRVGCIAAAAAAALVVAAPAQADTGTYAGTAGGTGKIALDVKIKNGHVIKLTHLRGKALPSNCETSGPGVPVNFDTAVSLPVKSPSGKFSGSLTQPTYGNVSTIKGQVKHKHVSGTIDVNYHYQAEDQYPEEDCDTGPLPFSAKFGATDETQPAPARLAR